MKTEELKKERLSPILYEIAAEGVPNSRDLWPSIRAHLKPNRRRVRLAALRPATRLGWAVLALATILTVSTVAYAVVPVVSRLFQQEVGLRDVEQAGLSQTIDRSQTIDGITVTLEQGYADANRIVVGYTISSSDGQRYDPHVALSDVNGVEFPPTTGMGLTGYSDVMGISLPPGEGSYVFSFDAAGLRGTPPTLDLHLEVTLREFVLAATDTTLAPTLDKLPAETTDPTVVELTPLRVEGELVGPFIFDFDLALNPGHVIEVGRVVEAAGIPLEVRQVVVTPSESRALLCIEPPDGAWERWAAMATLSTAEGQAGTAWSANPEGGCAVHAFLPSLYGQEGNWTLAVEELIRFFDVPGKDQMRLKGPWVFHFQVP